MLGDTDSTAQVHPYKLCHAMLDVFTAHGGQVLKGVVQGLHLEEGQLRGVWRGGPVHCYCYYYYC